MQGEPVKPRIRTLGLSVFNPDNDSDDDPFHTQPDTRQPTTRWLSSPKPLPIPDAAQGSYLHQQPPPQEIQSPDAARPPQSQPCDPIHSAPSSPSSIPTPAASSQPEFQLTNGARQADAQSFSRYAPVFRSLPLTENRPAVTNPGSPTRTPAATRMQSPSNAAHRRLPLDPSKGHFSSPALPKDLNNRLFKNSSHVTPRAQLSADPLIQPTLPPYQPRPSPSPHPSRKLVRTPLDDLNEDVLYGS
ncbi:hypothetical protein FRC00_001633 [Tulasnella sp. 408]|nr:hypothetical protein FRC00_001633 [Tulasnella sp. 408]